MAYPFGEIEKKWQDCWAKNKTFRAENKSSKPKYYALDMFPYPSGAGLHVGHPLGYIASDIVSRYKRLKGFNVLHPMGYDSFGLPAEQYAIQTGQHPAITTEQNIARYREQMDKIGFSFDWEREVRTSDPNYYKWTQWIFLKLFNSWYNPQTNKAESLDTLIPKLKNFSGLSEKEKSDLLMNYRLAYLSEAWVNWCPQLGTVLANEEVKDGVSERGGYPVERKLMPQWSLRITAYADRLLNDLEKIDWSESIKESQRNWIGKSEGSSLRFQVAPSPSGEGRGEVIEVFTTRPDTIFGVTFLTLAPESDFVSQLTTAEQKQKMEAYVHYAKSRSERDRQADVKKVTGEFTGAFAIHPFTKNKIPIWIGDYVLAGYGTGAVMGVPAHDSRDHAFAKHFGLEIKQVVEAPSSWDIQKESFDAKEGKCINSDFLNGLDVKDSIKRAIKEIENKTLGIGKTQFRLRDAIFGRQRYWGEPIPIYYRDGIPTAVEEKHLPIELPKIDKYLPTENGEPPLARAKDWKYDIERGARLGQDLGITEGYEFEKTTMPGWAGSSWYYLRYMVQDVKNIKPENDKAFADKEAINYWRDVDLYIGGSEHATGHLLYVRFWTKFLFDLGFIPVIEPAKKLINQGMIQGVSQMIYKSITKIFKDLEKDTSTPLSNYVLLPDKNGKLQVERFKDEHLGFKDVEELIVAYYSSDFVHKYGLEDEYHKFIPNNIDVNCVDGNNELDIDQFIKNNQWLNKNKGGTAFNIVFVCEGGYWKNETFISFDNGGSNKFRTKPEVEKMSKSKFNVVTPDKNPETNRNGIIDDFGADALRLYEMFLGPLEQSKPWSTSGISGVFNFLNRFWRLFHKENQSKNPEERINAPEVYSVSDEEPTKDELKILHRTIKKIQDDIENYSFNTSVSAFMICTNELMELKCNKKKILEPLVILLSPFAPHIAEELWNKLGHKESISFAEFPKYNEAFTIDNSFAYPISFNGKMRFNLELPLSLSSAEIEKEVMAFEQTKKYLEGKQPKKIIVVPKKIVNIVV